MELKYINRGFILDFFGLDDSERSQHILNFIMSRLVIKRYAHNSYICRAGDAAGAMYFIEDGVLSVRGKNGELINELLPGQYFGEYAAITGDKRMADVQARGAVLVVQLDAHTLKAVTRNSPDIYGIFLKKAYEQATEKYRKLVRLINSRRGLNKPAYTKRRPSLSSLFINYYLVFFVLLTVLLYCPDPAAGPLHPVWLCSPIAFLVIYIVITKRVLESIILSILYMTIMLAKLNFIGVFTRYVVEATTGTANIILIVVLMGSLTRLFSASGSINALKSIVEKRIKTGTGTLLTSFYVGVFTAIDEYLNILINGACFRPLSDQKGLPREKSAIVMGMSPMALCIISPISLTGLYLSGMIALSGGQKEFFISTIGFNFAAILTLGFVLLLSLNKMPLVGALKKAVLRVQAGGPLWPEGTENTGEDEEANRGRIANLVLPIVILIVSSIIIGSLEAGTFSVNVPSGMIIALIFMFFLYCFQQYMTPDQFFNGVVYGVESMVAPIVMFVMGNCFATGMEAIGFAQWLNKIVETLIGGQAWMLPALIFGTCTLVGALLDNPWAMYAIGIPLAFKLAVSMQGSPELYIGAVCGAGLLGNELALGDIFFIGSVLDIDPTAYYQAKLPYVIIIGSLAFFAYGIAGYLLR
ncbi:MAG: cyclic nucleotide-binding domain-containing protein [Spirochaetaceae bacterium]|nr:cyclic nucleotide-binding domain-containing protein [Spirochaetaceae bacterium]